MTYTTADVIEKAREVGASIDYEDKDLHLISTESITALCNKARTQTLLEAAEYVSRNLMSPREYAEKLRRMAGEEVIDDTYHWCIWCNRELPIVDGVIIHDNVFHGSNATFDEEEKPQ